VNVCTVSANGGIIPGMRGMLAALTLLGAIVSQTMTAAADCRCRGSDGTIFQQGELACIKTPKGLRLARCEMVLNNSSWTVVRDDCPSAMATPVPRFAALQEAIATAPRATGTVPHTDLH
jgi:hypothetical protein